MKPIRTASERTPGLRSYLEQEQEVEPSFGEFRSHEAGTAYRELRGTLVEIQHGLCGYCEIKLNNSMTQIEHVVPQNDRHCGAALTLDVTNMIACCMGGTIKTAAEEHYLPPVRENRSCGEAKGNTIGPHFIDPRSLPALPSVTAVNFEGTLHADPNACRQHGIGIGIESVRHTIAALGLNVLRLRRARKSRWEHLAATWIIHLEDPKLMADAAREELLPDETDRLSRFFSTNRSYFGPVGEDALKKEPRKWI